MSKYILKRLFGALLTILGVTLIVFLLLRLLPGDPARLLAGLTATPAEIEATRVRIGLDQPLPVQYVRFLGDLARGDIGTSITSRRPVLSEIIERLPYTLRLAFVTMALTALIGIPLGIFVAVRANTRWDYAVSVLSMIGISTPSYALGLLLIVIFAVNLQWFPAAGADRLVSIVLPAATLTIIFLPIVLRITRASMLDVLSRDYMRTAQSKGLHRRDVLNVHAFRNAVIPVITILGLQFGGLMSGAVLTETVFGYPGIGLMLTEAIFNRDFPVVQGVVMFVGLIFVMVNLLVDIVYAYLDPRIRYG